MKNYNILMINNLITTSRHLYDIDDWKRHDWRVCGVFSQKYTNTEVFGRYLNFVLHSRYLYYL